ncbi:MAG: hypothetical protein KDA24_30375, partial [Deltaproteobacteria bacterium]|nr:hypothetical protein [Deltaproteobacteria bacterium]
LGVDQLLPVLMTLWGAIAALFAVHVDRRLLATPLAYTAGAAGVLNWPEYRFWFTAAAALVFVINIGVIWRPRPAARTDRNSAPSGPAPPV